MSAVQFSRQQVGVIADALAVLHVLAAFFQHGIGPVPQLLADNRGDDLPRLILADHPLLRRKKFLFFGEQIHDLDLVAHIVPLVLGVGNHTRHGGVGDLFPVVVPIPHLPEQCLQLLHGVLPSGIPLKELPHHRGLILVNHQPPFVLLIAKNPAVAQHHTVLDGLLVSKPHPAAELTQLVLGNARHDGQTQLTVLVQCVDVIVLKKHSHSCREEAAGVLNRIQGISCKSGDFLCNDQVKQPVLPVCHHPVKIFPLFGGGRGQPLVDIALHIGPSGIFADKALVILDLIAQRVQLLIRLAGYTGVKGYPQRQVVDRTGF